MNFELTEDQRMMQESFARFFDEKSSPSVVREAMSGNGFDEQLWRGLAELGAFTLRVPEDSYGLGLGILDASVLMEEVGRRVVPGPIAETLVGARLLAQLGGAESIFEEMIAGGSVVSLALHDVAEQSHQWIAGGAVASHVLARSGDEVVLIGLAKTERFEANLASTALAEIDLREGDWLVLGSGRDAAEKFECALEEWKLLTAAALSGLAREAVRGAAAYACEREAFGNLIGTYQGISHPLADQIMHIDAGKYFIWRVIHDMAHDKGNSAAMVSMALWWNAKTSAESVAVALHTYGGYGLAVEYDVHIYNLRAKDYVLLLGDPERLLDEAGRRLYAGETASLPDAGDVVLDLDLGDEARALAAELNAFFEDNLTPELRAKAHYSFEGHDAGIHKKLAEHRLLFPSWPSEFGGRDAGAYCMEAVREVFEHQNWTSHAISTTSMVGTMIRLFGTEELKAEALTRIISGDAECSLGYSEPSGGSDVFAAKTMATRDGEGWRINGSKMWTSGAEIADYVLMITRTNTEVPKHRGLTMFLVPIKSEGVEVQAVHTFQDERTNITYYDNVYVPDTHRLGDVDGGVRVMAGALELEHSGGGFGRTQKAMVRAAEQLCRDEIMYRGSPLINDVSAQRRLARANTHVLLSEMITYRALWAGANKMPNMGFGPMGKLFSSEKFKEDASDLLNLTAPLSLSKREGAAGFVNLSYRHAQASTIYGGTSEVHRSQVAERALGLPRSRG